MEKLPAGDRAKIPLEKLTGYLLSKLHPVGRYKATFFESLGYSVENPKKLYNEIKRIASEGLVLQTIETQYGKKYVIKDRLHTSEGERVSVITVWIIETGSEIPRLVTAYPE